MPRIPLLTEATMTPEQKRVHDFVKGRSRDNHVGAPYQLALHCPEFLERWQQVGETLRYYNSLPPALSEMAILITARHTSLRLLHRSPRKTFRQRRNLQTRARALRHPGHGRTHRADRPLRDDRHDDQRARVRHGRTGGAVTGTGIVARCFCGSIYCALAR